MKLRSVLHKVNKIKCNIDLETEISSIRYDSSLVTPGDIFVAIRGLEVDGHSFIPAAVENGAICVICECPPVVSVPYILVENSRIALAEISAAYFGFPAEQLIIIGVTGTNGKTTVTNLLKEVIEHCEDTKVGLIGTNGVLIGEVELSSTHTTPESYEIQRLLSVMVSQGCRYCVMEVSSHALELDRVHGIIFDVGVFTNLSQDHLDFHLTMEKYAEAKAKLFSVSKKAAINSDDDYANIMIKRAACPVLTYAVNNGSADLLAKDVKLHKDKVEFCALTTGVLVRTELPIPGMFSVYNVLAVLSASSLLNIDLSCAAEALKSCKSVKGRVEVVPTDRDFTIIIDYAHTPAALENIAKAARDITAGRVITLFGCGGDRDKNKRPLMAAAAAENSDVIIVTTDNPRTEAPEKIIDDIMKGVGDDKDKFVTIVNRVEAIHWAIDNAKAGDVIVLAGKGHETYQAVGTEKFHFDEREIVAEYLRDSGTIKL